TTTVTPRKTAIISGRRSLSSRRCIWNASMICLTRPGLFRRCSLAAAFLAALSCLAMTLRVRASSLLSADPWQTRPAPSRSLEQAGCLLPGGAGLGEVLEFPRQRQPAVQAGLGVHPAGSVGVAHQPSGQDSREPGLFGRLGVLDELLGVDPALHR